MHFTCILIFMSMHTLYRGNSHKGADKPHVLEMHPPPPSSNCQGNQYDLSFSKPQFGHGLVSQDVRNTWDFILSNTLRNLK